jgi:hypothetical protein
VDEAMADAISLKFLKEPMSPDQLDQFFQYQLPRTP